MVPIPNTQGNRLPGRINIIAIVVVITQSCRSGCFLSLRFRVNKNPLNLVSGIYQSLQYDSEQTHITQERALCETRRECAQLKMRWIKAALMPGIRHGSWERERLPSLNKTLLWFTARLSDVRSWFQTWGEECQVEDEGHQDEPGVGCWTVVVGPDGAVGSFCAVGTPGWRKHCKEIKTSISPRVSP